MKRRHLLLAACVLLPLGSTLAQGSQQAKGKRQGQRHQVVIEAMRYEPSELKLNAGDEVEWINKDPFPHTATAKGLFDTGEIAAGKKKILRMTHKGRMEYFCSLHPTMKAVLLSQ